jgi:site-specific DNA recombinase
VREALEKIDPLWEELFPTEQARIVQLLVQRVDLKADGLELRLRTQGLGHVVQELGTIGDYLRRAA